MRLRHSDHSARRRARPFAVVQSVGLASLAIVVLLLIPGGPFGNPVGVSTASPTNPRVTEVAAPAHAPVQPSRIRSAPSAPSSAKLTVESPSDAQAIPTAFWGTNILAENKLGSADAVSIADTPVTFVRFPGGTLGEQFNYTSGVITNDNGSTTLAITSVPSFIQVCKDMGCSAILQLPAEINSPSTAAYYANYVVHTLGFQPAYWEIGNSPPNWDHYNVPWSKWDTTKGITLTPLLFAQLVGNYIRAVKAVDPQAKFTALALGAANYDKSWITELVSLDGENLSGVSIHSYTFGPSPPNLTWANFLSNLNGQYSLQTQVRLTREYITAACSTCSTKVFVTESNGAENAYESMDSSFAGTLYVAAATVQALHVRLTNLDWFCYACEFGGTWRVGGTKWSQQYTLFSQMMTRLGPDTLWTNTTGPSTFYATTTYGPSGMALLLVNTNLTTSVDVNLSHTGIIAGSIVTREQWVNGTNGPKNSTFTLTGSVKIGPMAIWVLTVPQSSVTTGGSHHTALHLSVGNTRMKPHPGKRTHKGKAPVRASASPIVPTSFIGVSLGPLPMHALTPGNDLAPSWSERAMRGGE